VEPATCEICGDELEKAWPYDGYDACCDAAVFTALAMIVLRVAMAVMRAS
jgi:hypothetical protein